MGHKNRCCFQQAQPFFLAQPLQAQRVHLASPCGGAQQLPFFGGFGGFAAPQQFQQPFFGGFAPQPFAPQPFFGGFAPQPQFSSYLPLQGGCGSSFGGASFGQYYGF